MRFRELGICNNQTEVTEDNLKVLVGYSTHAVLFLASPTRGNSILWLLRKLCS